MAMVLVFFVAGMQLKKKLKNIEMIPSLRTKSVSNLNM